MKKNILKGIYLVIILCFSLSIFTKEAYAAEPFVWEKGLELGITNEGTESDPYQISTYEQLLAIGLVANKVEGKYFELTTNISGFSANIGNEAMKFNGHFDGKGHTIELNIPGGDYYEGLFGWIDKAGTVTNVNVTGTIHGIIYIGGIAGKNEGIISNCKSNITITGNAEIGGICGINTSSDGTKGIIVNCYSSGTISGENNLGGICGSSTNGKIINSSSNVDLTGDDQIGGIAGANGGEITNCFYYGDIVIVPASGVICGHNGNGNVNMCFYDNDKYPVSDTAVRNIDEGTSNNVYGLPLSQMKGMKEETNEDGWVSVSGNKKSLVDILNDYLKTEPYTELSLNFLEWTIDDNYYPYLSTIIAPGVVKGRRPTDYLYGWEDMYVITDKLGHPTYYEDYECTKVITDASEWEVSEGWIPSTIGLNNEHHHKYNEIVYLWSDDLSKCTAYDVCKAKNCHYVDLETVNAVYSGGVYVATFTNANFERQEKSPRSSSKAKTIEVIKEVEVSKEKVILKDKDGTTYIGTLNDDGTYSLISDKEIVNKELEYNPLSSLPSKGIKLVIGSLFAGIDGEIITLDTCPIIRDNRTMLPIRFIAEYLGAKVDWNENNPNEIIITKESKVIKITIGKDKALINNKEYLLDSIPFIENDRTYMPVRFISEALNAEVIWNEDKPNEIIIKQK